MNETLKSDKKYKITINNTVYEANYLGCGKFSEVYALDLQTVAVFTKNDITKLLLSKLNTDNFHIPKITYV